MKICSDKPSLIIINYVETISISENKHDEHQCLKPIKRTIFEKETTEADLRISPFSYDTGHALTYPPFPSQSRTNYEIVDIVPLETKTNLNNEYILFNKIKKDKNISYMSSHNIRSEKNYFNSGPKYDTEGIHHNKDDEILFVPITNEDEYRVFQSNEAERLKLHLSIADPQQIYLEINLRFIYKNRSSEFIISLPENPMRGSSVRSCLII